MTAKLLLLGLFIFVMIIMSLNHGKKKKKVIFFGDIINDLDTKPGGYISWIINHLKNEGLEERYNIVNAQKAGENIYDMYLRVEEDVLVKDAAIVVIYAGVNDVWYKYLSGTGTDAGKFETFYQALVNRLQAANIKVAVCIPAAQLNRELNETIVHEIGTYCAIIREVATQNNLPCIDLDKVLSAPQLLQGDETTTPMIVDQFTPEYNINKFIADEIWKALREII